MNISQARTEISHGCDGPITAFVLMSRATGLVAQGVDPEIAANALYEELLEFGFIHPNSSPVVLDHS